MCLLRTKALQISNRCNKILDYFHLHNFPPHFLKKNAS
uniref:Uncharacterized protein n=1 Tax=Ascaris lumbricoides TaxID=6252 RepID=A0A0M3ITN9_ASCLU